MAIYNTNSELKKKFIMVMTNFDTIKYILNIK